MSDTLHILCLGDIVARPGRLAVKRMLAGLRKEHAVDVVIANGENASGGMGLDPRTASEIFEAGVDIITLGDHTWRRRELRSYLDKTADRLIRPANYPGDAPGKGCCIFSLSDGTEIGVMNLIGRTFLSSALDCPFQYADDILDNELRDCTIRICDIHAEATSEKIALGRYLDGQVSFIFGTHTHVQTADNRVLPDGTGFISDLGMCGSTNGVIGLDSEIALDRFLTGQPRSYKPARGSSAVSGALVEIEKASGRAVRVERIFEMDGK